MIAAGYAVQNSELKKIHCNEQPGCEELEFMENGFVQCFVEVDGRQARVMDYAPGQQLQPHKHNIDELFEIRGGSVLVSKFPSNQPDKIETYTLKKGDLIEISSNVIHGLNCDPVEGLQFHELVGTGEEAFQKRTTQFVVAEGYKLAFPPVCGSLKDKVVLLTGANRGLGLGFVRHLAERGAVIIGACRNPSNAKEMDALLATAPGSFSVALDLQSDESITKAAEEVASKVSTIDILINNAGISSKNHPVDPVVSVDGDELMNILRTNVVGTLNTTQAFLPLLEKGNSKVVMNLSSQLGSIDKCWGIQGRYGGVGCYRMSRAANNMMMRCFGGELRDQGFVFIAMSPGHVNTDMGASGGRKPPLEVPQSVDGMLQVLESLSKADNGKFLQYDGSELPW